jgi:hypothetical protein
LESDLLLATELAGNFTAINDELVDALLSILRSGDRSEAVRGRAAISLGLVLEHADTEPFEDAEAIGEWAPPGRTSPPSSPRARPRSPYGWPRSTPLRKYLEHLYLKRFGRACPDAAIPIEDRGRLQEQKKKARRAAKRHRAAEAP